MIIFLKILHVGIEAHSLPQSTHSLLEIDVHADYVVTINVKNNGLPVLPVKVQVVYRSSHFR